MKKRKSFVTNFTNGHEWVKYRKPFLVTEFRRGKERGSLRKMENRKFFSHELHEWTRILENLFWSRSCAEWKREV